MATRNNPNTNSSRNLDASQPFTFTTDRYSYFPGQIGLAKVTLREKANIDGINLYLIRKSNRLKDLAVARFSASEDAFTPETLVFTIPFEIPRIIPSSFKGKKLKIWYEWLVEIDIPWARDSVLSQPLKIIPMPLGNKSLAMFIKTSPLPQKKRGFFASRRNKILFLFFCMMFLGIPLVVTPIIMIIRKLLLRRFIRDYKVIVPRKEWAMGEKLPVEVHIRSNQELILNNMDAFLDATESFWKSGRGKRKLKTFFAYQGSVHLSDARPIQAGDGNVIFKGELGIPPDLPSMDKNMTWQLLIHIDIASCPDIKWTEEILVLPMLYLQDAKGKPSPKAGPRK